jgi:small-conductance mechanosensitive channel
MLLQAIPFQDQLNQIGAQAFVFLTQVVTFLAAVIVIYLAGRLLIERVVGRVLRAREVDPTLRKPALKVTRAGVVFLAVVVGLAVSGFGNLLTAAATLAAALTLALGFASQDVISNLVGGVFLIGDPSFNIGDWIEWDDNAGVIEDISFRVTRVRTFNNELVTVPNSTLANTDITNPVAKDTLRVTFPFGIGYGDDIDRATDIIVEEAESHEDILDEPPTTVRLTELGSSAVVLVSRFWIGNPSRADFVKTRSEYVQTVKERFDEEGIDMPYDYRQLTGSIRVDADVEQLVGETMGDGSAVTDGEGTD